MAPNPVEQLSTSRGPVSLRLGLLNLGSYQPLLAIESVTISRIVSYRFLAVKAVACLVYPPLVGQLLLNTQKSILENLD
jgi:hypothetical protein